MPQVLGMYLLRGHILQSTEYMWCQRVHMAPKYVQSTRGQIMWMEYMWTKYVDKVHVVPKSNFMGAKFCDSGNSQESNEIWHTTHTN